MQENNTEGTAGVSGERSMEVIKSGAVLSATGDVIPTPPGNFVTKDVEFPEAPPKEAPTWEFEGRKYDLFLVNGTGGVGLPIKHPTKEDKLGGMITAEFAWEDSEPFLNYLDIETIDRVKSHGDWTDRENESMIIQRAGLYREIVQRGSSIDYDDFGDVLRETAKDRAGMMAYRKPVQSDIIDVWLTSCHIQRWLPEGMTSIDAFLTNPKEIYFTCKIGDFDNPRHLLFVEFAAPTDDAISAYTTETFKRGQNAEGDWRFRRDHDARLKFPKKYLRSVKGAMIGPKGQLEFDDSALTEITPGDDQALASFRRMFNPDWMIKLGEELAGCFSMAKK